MPEMQVGDAVGADVGLGPPSGKVFCVPDRATTARHAVIDAESVMLVAGTPARLVSTPNWAPCVMR